MATRCFASALRSYSTIDCKGRRGGVDEFSLPYLIVGYFVGRQLKGEDNFHVVSDRYRVDLRVICEESEQTVSDESHLLNSCEEAG